MPQSVGHWTGHLRLYACFCIQRVPQTTGLRIEYQPSYISPLCSAYVVSNCAVRFDMGFMLVTLGEKQNTYRIFLKTTQ